MDVTPLIEGDRQVIDGYGPGVFHIAGEPRDGSVLVFPERTLGWAATSFDKLTIEDFQPVIDAAPPVELLLLGCGERMLMPPAQLRAALRACGIVLEPMDTGAACRTFNVLLAEDRRVAAALFAL